MFSKEMLQLSIKGNLTVLDNGAESKWEYMGFGIWENREGGSPSPPPPGTVSIFKNFQIKNYIPVI
jgi:hypothetical protein